MNSPLSKAVVLAFAITVSLHAANIEGTVTNKTTGKPSGGDKVALVDFSAGMSDAATATTNVAGQYTLQTPGSGSYLIRVDHQGASYFIAAPQNNSPADITVYDVAAKVEGVGVDADMLLIEAGQGTLHVRERYLVRNTSSPPRAQFSDNTFEIALPEGAQFEEAAATRPGGMGTRTHLISRPQKGHYSFNVPIQPNQGEKETMFEVSYYFPYSGRHSFTVHPIAPIYHFVVYTPQGINFTATDSARFKRAHEDSRVDTHVAMDLHPGEDIVFEISGEGRMPSDASGATMQMSNAAVQSMPGGGIGAPTGSADPTTSPKGWLFAVFAVLLSGVAVLVLRPRTQTIATDVEMVQQSPGAARRSEPVSTLPAVSSSQPARLESTTLLETVKEELFALEQDKISGRVSPEEYARVSAGLETVLRRALDNRGQQ